MSLSQSTDEQILKGLDKLSSSGTDQMISISFVLGDKDANKPVFFLMVKAGELGSSEPDEMLDSISKYSKVSVELYYYRDLTEDEVSTLNEDSDPVEFEIDGQKFSVNIDWHVFPHLAIDPRSDELFKEQLWASLFNRATIGYMAKVDLPTLCQIIRFCDQMSGLKAFW